MNASVSIRRAVSLALGLAAFSVASPSFAQQAPGWLNWGGSSQDEAAEASQERPATQATSVPVADTGGANQSGQAVLLQRLMQRVDELEREMRSVRGQLSEQERQISRQADRVDEALEAAKTRPSGMTAGAMPSTAAGSGGVAGPEAPSSPESPAAPTAPAAADGGSTAAAAGAGGSVGSEGAQGDQGGDQGAELATDEEQQALYNEAFTVLKSGDYDGAIAAFQKVIDANPQGGWAPSAFFWKGETYYVKQEYDAARKSYAELVERFPQSRRIPDAKLKMGYIAQEQGDRETARQLFNQVTAQYPDSQAASLAKQRLSRMGGG